MRKYQLKFVTMYIRHRAQTLGLEKIRPHGTASRGGAAPFPVRIRMRSASFVERSSSGRLRNRATHATHQRTASAANSQRVCRQSSPTTAVRKTQMNGVSPPMNRAAIHTAPLANARLFSGNQL